MSFRSTIVAAALLATVANAHMTMETPVIFSQDKALIDTAPITAEQYPCHSQYGFEVTKMNPMTAGQSGKVVLKGSAFHGGGSCQLSVTTDPVPTKDSKFKVIKSFEGNCPMGAGAELEYTLPASIPNGKGTFAWTWFSLLSGGPEMYMNCAPIEVTGGASDTAGFDALPDMLIANIGSTTCKRVEGSPIKFPNPGADVAVADGTSKAALPTGDCGATGSTPPVDTPPAASSAPVTPPAASSAPVTPPAASSAPVVPPAASSPVAVPTPVASSAPVASSPPIVAPPVASTAPVPTPVTPPTTGGSTCTTNGAVVCNGTTQFGLCNNGSIVWQPVAAGTTCVNGAIVKRSTAFKSSYNGRIVRPRSPVAYKV